MQRLFLRSRCFLLLVTASLISGWGLSTSSRLTRLIAARLSHMKPPATSPQSDQERCKAPLSVLGVCGGIGSGKSQASKLLVSELGCAAHIDADSVAHIVYEPGSQALQEIAQEFGSEIIDENGQVDRKQLGGIVFADASAMSKLEHIVWPHVKEEIKKRIKDIEAAFDNTKLPVVVLEAAMLLDAGWEDLLDGLWVVTTSRATALDRLVTSRGLTKEEAQNRMDAQESRRGVGNLDEEISNGSVTACIRNNGALEDLTCTLQKALFDPKNWKHPSAVPNIAQVSSSPSIADTNKQR